MHFSLGKITLLFCFLACVKTVNAQENASMPPETFTITVGHDPAFGFLPGANGSFPLTKKYSFTYYGLFWTNPGYSNREAATDYWLEAGAGVSWFSKNGQWLWNPSLGLTHGVLLSGAARGVFGDGVVPNVVAFHKNSRFEGEYYAGYYKSLRKEGPVSSDYLLAWAYPGIIVNKHVALGAHVENFRLLRATDSDPINIYTWLGAYVKFTVGEKYWFRFAGGVNLEDNGLMGGDYYRLSVGIPLL